MSKADADMLVELATVDEVYAWIPTDMDGRNEITPQWCELVLEVKRTDDGELTPAWPLNVRMPLRRHDGELMIQVIHEVLHPNSGGEPRDMLWVELDEVVDRIQDRIERGKDPLKRDVGQALGLATALAILENPYAYDVDQIREAAMERYEGRNA